MVLPYSGGSETVLMQYISQTSFLIVP